MEQEYNMSQAALRYEEKARETAAQQRASTAGEPSDGPARPMAYKSPYEEIQYDVPKKRQGNAAANRMLGDGGRGETMPAFAHVS